MRESHPLPYSPPIGAPEALLKNYFNNRSSKLARALFVSQRQCASERLEIRAALACDIGAALGQRKRVTPIWHQLSHMDFGPLAGIKEILLNDFDTFLLELETRIDRRTREKER